MKQIALRLSICLLAAVCISLTSCSKDDKYNVEDLFGTWSYTYNGQEYQATFADGGVLTYKAPGITGSYNVTYSLDGDMIYLRVKIGDTEVNDVLKIKDLTADTLVVYYDGNLLFDGQELSATYTFHKVK